MKTLELREYAEDIKLFEPWVPPARVNAAEAEYLLYYVLSELRLEEDLNFFSSANNPGDDFAGRMLLLRALLNIRPPTPMRPDLIEAIEKLLLFQSDSLDITSAADLTESEPGIAVWRGDISSLRADAIVNAANSALLGCFQPLHKCIDNAIHSAAGPALRRDCARIMRMQGMDEPTGLAKATRAYALPSRFVLHTVGPVVAGARPSPEQEALLASCYEKCLELAAQMDSALRNKKLPGMASLAFCCISTGLFGYPAKEAAVTAVNTVRKFVSGPGRGIKVVFNVFSEKDEKIYSELVG